MADTFFYWQAQKQRSILSNKKSKVVEKTRPFLKWAGGKCQIVERIRQSLPDGNRLIEPFVGAGSVFLNTQYARYTLNDINQDLISVFKYLKKDKVNFIKYCKKYFITDNNTKDAFVGLRELFNNTGDTRLKAALFVYLNRHSFNGLIRYNQSGNFNTSFGDYRKPYFPENEMVFFLRKIYKAKLLCADFSKVMIQARAGDVVYCDPPYVPLSITANFTKYYSSAFGLPEQEKLVLLAKELASKGVTVVISNHDTEFVQDLYRGATINRFEVRRFISCNATTRKKAKELLAIFD